MARLSYQSTTTTKTPKPKPAGRWHVPATGERMEIYAATEGRATVVTDPAGYPIFYVFEHKGPRKWELAHVDAWEDLRDVAEWQRRRERCRRLGLYDPLRRDPGELGALLHEAFKLFDPPTQREPEPEPERDPLGDARSRAMYERMRGMGEPQPVAQPQPQRVTPAAWIGLSIEI